MKRLKELSEKLKEGQYWVKGSVERIYINSLGWNTKKMTTKTFIYLDEVGEFKVSCFIDCPSQPMTWINSQKNSIIDKVKIMLEEALSDKVFYKTNQQNNAVDDDDNIIQLDNVYYDGEFVFKEQRAEMLYDNYASISKEEFYKKNKIEQVF